MTTAHYDDDDDDGDDIINSLVVFTYCIVIINYLRSFARSLAPSCGWAEQSKHTLGGAYYRAATMYTTERDKQYEATAAAATLRPMIYRRRRRRRLREIEFVICSLLLDWLRRANIVLRAN